MDCGDLIMDRGREDVELNRGETQHLIEDVIEFVGILGHQLLGVATSDLLAVLHQPNPKVTLLFVVLSR